MNTPIIKAEDPRKGIFFFSKNRPHGRRPYGRTPFSGGVSRSDTERRAEYYERVDERDLAVAVHVGVFDLPGRELHKP